MQVDKFWEVVNFVEGILIKYNFQGTYQNILNFLNQSRNTPQNQPNRQNVNNLRSQVTNQQNEVAFPEDWDSETYELFVKIGGEKFIGKKAVKELDRVFSEYPANEAKTVTEFQTLLNELNQFRPKISQAVNGLIGWKDIEVIPQMNSNELAIKLIFKDGAEIKTIDDMKKCADDWQKIFTAFSRLEDQPPEAARILNIRKGSFILDIAGTSLIVAGVARGTMEILRVIEKYLSLKKNALEIKHLELENKKLEQDIEKEADALLEDKANKIAEKFFVDNPKWHGKNHGEEQNNVSLALRLISSFIENGGTIEFIKNIQAPLDDQIKILFESVNKIEVKINETRLFLTDSKKAK